MFCFRRKTINNVFRRNSEMTKFVKTVSNSVTDINRLSLERYLLQHGTKTKENP
jgi:hypothetical protein